MHIPKRIPNYQDIIDKEKIIYNETKTTFGKWFAKFEKLIDLFLEISYLETHCNTIASSSSDYAFYWYAQDIFKELPCALRSCSSRLECGYYTDALIGCRTLLEPLMILKYFHSDKPTAASYFNSQKCSKGKRITFEMIFNKIAPGTYTEVYGFLCKPTHKGFGTSLPSLVSRLNSQSKTSDKQTPILPLPVFNRELAEIVIKHLLAIISGYLNSAPYFLSSEINTPTQPVNEHYKNLKDWVHDMIQKNKATFPDSEKWSLLLEEIAKVPQI